MIFKTSNFKETMTNKISSIMIKLKTNLTIKSHHPIPNSKFKTLLNLSNKLTSIKNKSKKKKIPWLNIIVNKMPFFNGWPIILDKNGVTLNFLVLQGSSMKTKQISLNGYQLWKIFNGKDLNKSLKIQSLWLLTKIKMENLSISISSMVFSLKIGSLVLYQSYLRDFLL